MAYFADGNFTFTFDEEDGIIAAAAALGPYPPLADAPVHTLDEAREIVRHAAGEVAEVSDVAFDVDGITVYGWANGKFHSDRWDRLLASLSLYAAGSGTWHADNGDHWQNRLYADGTIEESQID